jgi:hypothetical protein
VSHRLLPTLNAEAPFLISGREDDVRKGNAKAFVFERDHRIRFKGYCLERCYRTSMLDYCTLSNALTGRVCASCARRFRSGALPAYPLARGGFGLCCGPRLAVIQNRFLARAGACYVVYPLSLLPSKVGLR